ncbi:TonB-dependent receptor [Hallella bergensis]|uniref:SusC/RagA family TonB-linked outer membrane protein n=1 Tax=Hallella bergensis TaxID=242750 RepID=UPI0023F10A27|nr:TonB-dependent receptor [Hallella bergensis]
MNKKYKWLILGCVVQCVVPTIGMSQTQDTTVVEIGYGKQDRWKTTSAISTVDNDELMKITAPSVGNTLEGMLPGLTSIQPSGEPGYDFYLTNMYSRGLSSFVSGQKMLVIVDGYEAPLDYLSTEEVESISLLKDAAALAVYGARGANGVLLVTTKKGRISAPKISLRLQTGLQAATAMDDPLDAYDYARLYNQARANDGLAPRYTSEELSAYQNGSNPYLYPNVNWKDEMLKKSAPLTFAEMAFRGGTDVIRYYVMAGMMQNNGLYKGTDSKRKESSNAYFARFNFRANVDVNITKNFLASLYSGVSVGDLSTPGGNSSAASLIGSMWGTPPNAFPIRNPNGTFGGNSTYTNPIGNITNRGLYKENSRALQIIFNLKYDLSDMVQGLSVAAGVGYNNYMADTSSKTRDYARYALAADPTAEDGYKYTVYGADAPLTATEGFRTDYTRVNFKAQVDYSNTFGYHGIDASMFFLSDLYKVYGVRDDTKYLNYAGRFTYNYNKTYIAEFSASYMGTDNFAPNSRYGFFPAVSVGWVASNEKFMENVTWLDFLKFRASYGQVGNDQTSARYIFDATYNSNGSYLFGINSSTSSGFREVSLSNPDVSWERKNILNIGLDAKLLQHLTVGFDIFSESQKDILVQPYSAVPGFIGASYGDVLPYMNVGRVDNHGFEVCLRWDGKVGNDFNYYVQGATWYARNKVKEMGEDLRAYDYLYHRGNSVWRPIVLIADGLYQESDFDADGNLKDGMPIPQYGKVAPGDIKYVDQNNDNIIDDNDTHPVGYSAIPEWNYAFNLGFRWKGFDFSAILQGVANRDVYLSGKSIYSFKDNGTASPLALDSWTDGNPDASYPRLSTVMFDNNYRTSTFWKRNGSYLRLRNVQLGYSLPESVLKAIKLNNIYVYINATNLFTVAHLDGMGDPEMNALTNYPITKTCNVGLKVTF